MDSATVNSPIYSSAAVLKLWGQHFGCCHSAFLEEFGQSSSTALKERIGKCEVIEAKQSVWLITSIANERVNHHVSHWGRFFLWRQQSSADGSTNRKYTNKRNEAGSQKGELFGFSSGKNQQPSSWCLHTWRDGNDNSIHTTGRKVEPQTKQKVAELGPLARQLVLKLL